MRVGIFGAGQAGWMVSQWLPAGEELVCFIDNSEKKQGGQFGGVPVCSLQEALDMHLDRIWAAVLNQEAAGQICRQIAESGFAGEVTGLEPFRRRQDIRLAALRLLAGELVQRRTPGEMAELGVFQGAFAAEMNRLLPEKKLYLFDTFSGFDDRDLGTERRLGNMRVKAGDFADTDMERVRGRLPHPEQAVFCPGYFPESLAGANPLPQMALVSLDPDLFEPTYQGLCVFYPLLSPGGMILVHDYNSAQFPGVGEAVRRFCRERQVFPVPLMDLHGSAVIVKA